MYDREDSAPALLSFLIGGLVGASLTVLFTPESGSATRRRISKGVRDTARRARDAARRAGEASERLVEGPAAATVPEPGLPTDMGRGNRG